jgi:hypothetical protein
MVTLCPNVMVLSLCSLFFSMSKVTTTLKENKTTLGGGDRPQQTLQNNLYSTLKTKIKNR